MKHTEPSEHIRSVASLGFGLFGLLFWAFTHLIGGADPGRLFGQGDAVAFLAGVGALTLGVQALRQLEPTPISHRRATEGFVFGVIVLALTVGLSIL